MAKTFDVVVIGGGPGGYIAAIRAAQLGLKTACVDEWRMADGKPALGGTCTNVGCIPSKALLQSSENFEHAGHRFAEHGIQVKGLALDLAQMLARKDKVVKQNNDGIVFLFKKNKIEFFHGRGSFSGAAKASGADGWEIKVAGNTEATLAAKHVIIATGSNPRALPEAAFDEKLVLSNTGALAITEVPQRLGVVGAGVIGLEMGSVWRRLGAEVTLLEALPVFLGAVDEQIAKEAAKLFAKQGLAIHTGVKITKVMAKKSVTVEYTDGAGVAQSATFDKLIVSIGRVPNTDGLNAAAAGLKLDERGFIAVDGDCRTNLSNVWAIGDVVRGPMLAHKAEEEGVAVAGAHLGPSRPRRFQYRAVGHLHLARDRVGRPERAAAEGCRRRVPRGHLPVHGERPCTGAGRHHRHGEDACRRRHRPHSRRAHHRADGLGARSPKRWLRWSSAPRPRTSR